MLEVSRVCKNSEKNNVLSVGKGKKQKNVIFVLLGA